MSRGGETSMREEIPPYADRTGARSNRVRQFLWLAWGLVLGAFVARLGLEATGRPLPRPIILLVALLSMVIGAAVVWRVGSASHRTRGHPLRRSRRR